MAWPALGAILAKIIGGGAAAGAAGGAAGAGTAGAAGAGAAGAGAAGASGGAGLLSGLLGGGGGGATGSTGAGGMMGGGDFWSDFTQRFQSPEGWQEMQLKQNEQGRKQMAAATNLSQTVRPRGRVQELGPQSNAPYAKQWANPGSTALQQLVRDITMRRGGGI